MIQRLLPALLLAGAAGAALAKLPAPQQDEAAKAKAAEAAAKTAWQGKVDAYQLCKAQDRIAAKYGSKGGASAKPAAAPASKPASAPAAAASGSTPVASSAPPPCADPGPFAYNPPQQTPLETSGAHSPAGNATKPPSVPATSAQMQPAKK